MKTPKTTTASAIPSVDVRMYCMGTGDCFVLKFNMPGLEQPFTMMIDCGSCVGTPDDFRPYLENLAEWVGVGKDAETGKTTKGKIDLLVVTHEHNDHVNGFAKCPEIFDDINITEAWFAWTENPKDPDGKAQELRKKQERMRKGFQKAMNKISECRAKIEQEQNSDYKDSAVAALSGFLEGLNTLGKINLEQPLEMDKLSLKGQALVKKMKIAESTEPGNSLKGMVIIKKLLEKKRTVVNYLLPGVSLELPLLPGVKFHVLGPPLDKQYIYKDGREGTDVYRRKASSFAIGEGILAMNTFANLKEDPTKANMGEAPMEADLPFSAEYVFDHPALSQTAQQEKAQHLSMQTRPNNSGQPPAGRQQAEHRMNQYLINANRLIARYDHPENQWRTIENEWLYSAGSLAIRLNSHINNTSLALAVEFGKKGKVILLPGDAEYGSWESWHLIDQWKEAGKDGKPFVESLLNRTVFYKVSHHLSFNGTALAKGIMMMNSPNLASMVTLDRSRISEKWKSTMPNTPLLIELNKRCKGRCFIMSEFDFSANQPSTVLNPTILGSKRYQEISNGQLVLAKQYTVPL